MRHSQRRILGFSSLGVQKIAALGAALTLAALLQGSSSAAGATTAVDLGTLGGTGSEAIAINASGQVVGASGDASNNEHAFSWTEANGMVALGTLGGSTSRASDVNDDGQVVGRSNNAAGESHAFSWTQAAGMVDIGTIGGTFSESTAVNSLGQVVGLSEKSAGGQHGFSWTQAGGIVDMGSLDPPNGDSGAYDVNDAGQAVGFTTMPAGPAHAMLWTEAGGMVDLGSLGGEAIANAINNHGQVVGYSYTSAGEIHAFSWTQAGGMVDLGAPRGFARALNESGQVVGSAGPDAYADQRAFLWTQAGGMVDLGTLGGTESHAVAINESGQVVGTTSGYANGGFPHAFSWTQAGGMVDLGTGTAVAVNDVGQVVGRSFDSGHATLWTVGTSASVPDAPAAPVATAGNGSAEVSWSAPNDGGSPITSYTVTASPGGQTATVNGSTLTAVVSGLTNCATYTFSVRATNAIGTSQPSAASNAVAPSTTTAVSVGESSKQVAYSPQRIDVPGEQCVRVKWTFKSTNTRSHTVTEASNSGLGIGPANAPLFNSGPVAAGGSFEYLFRGATTYLYRSTAAGDSNSPSLYGVVRMPVIVSPTSGSKATAFTVRFAREAIPGYSFALEYQSKLTTAKSWPSTWIAPSSLSNLTGTTAMFTPPAKDKAGMYRFRSIIKNQATGRTGGYSWTDSSGLTCPCQITVT